MKVAPVISTFLLFFVMATASAQHADTGTSSVDDEVPVPSAFLGNIAFWVSDFEAMRAFYSDVVGVPEAAAGMTPRPWVYYVQDGFSFSLLKGKDYTPERPGWARCPMPGSTGDSWRPYITFYVPDLQAAIARCKAAGIVVRTEKPFSLGEGFGESIEVMDPDGNAIALTERPEKGE